MSASSRGPRDVRFMVGLPAAITPGVPAAGRLGVVTDDDAAASDGIHGVACSPATATATSVGPYGAEQMANAHLIVDIGTARRIPEHGIITALMASMAESSLHNLDHGDRDSLGLFQMRPSQGWGTAAQLTDPHYTINKFYDTLLAVPDWQTLAPGAAAQAVERSAFPDRYTTHEQTAREILGTVNGIRCPARSAAPPSDQRSDQRGDERSDLPSNPRARTVIDAALSQLGVPYAWAGGTARGPSAGTGADSNVIGFDCNGLALY